MSATQTEISAGIISVDIISCQQADMPLRGDAHDFLEKLSAAQTEISAGIISVDIIPYRNTVKKNGYCTMKKIFQTILIISLLFTRCR
ncbi:hypothetical protein DWZ56_10135 [Lachnotalea sp. AF33-28]|nr:hypothetical protein DWZ56_10135 [Lachnotalea sp. AF33-28]